MLPEGRERGRLGQNYFRNGKVIPTLNIYNICMEKSNLISIEKDRINVTVSTLLKIANVLEVEVGEFFQ